MLKTPLLFVSVLKVLSKFYKLILARADLKRDFGVQRHRFSFLFLPQFFCAFLTLSAKILGKTTQSKRYTGYVSHFSRFVLVYYITHTQVLPHPSFQEGRAEYKCKKKQGTRGRRGAEIHRRGERGEMVIEEEEEGEEVWKKKQRSSTNYNYVA